MLPDSDEGDTSVSSTSALESTSDSEDEGEYEVDQGFYDQLMIIANKLGDDWPWLALQLGFSSTDIGRITKYYHSSCQANQCLEEWIEREQWGATLDTMLVGLRAAGLHQIAGKVETGELFQKDVDDACCGSEWKGDKDYGSSSDGDIDHDGDSSGVAGKVMPHSSITHGDHKPDDRLPDNTDREGSVSEPGGSHSNKEGGDISQEGGILPHSGGKQLSDDSDSESSSESGGSHSNMEVGDISEEDGSTSLDSGSHISTASPSKYPTGEDASAWNDCLQDFFKADEDTARSIQESWPSNLLVKHLVRDRFFHSHLCEYWEQYKS
ncbi:PREDICTED: dentin sialophosphoprotein-like [Branchiostoma belcheri]|uniref:Dentin sialophosphoprotein-like n=1 Tax=Branchiostoma belcheri TaxID=7741 RepID=A0A6P4ZEM0_BRABE|nr:PREDICTED: dentin sialophosphoprotein-like [Branchiostoma belcheri]